jgi:hypothetical protein
LSNGKKLKAQIAQPAHPKPKSQESCQMLYKSLINAIHFEESAGLE